ncbi:RNA polymerase sigma factor [Parapedobacter indicus]|uniref:RNA polymerase sigma factor SigS n=1 Tax=Parapedobacter indicus TaxID=1477437 RepID=A0A1I3H9S9_9SPHI|nr:sigma-70 family RNA polymerase sigma factor [Parapedobacter indicus]PPL02946.1 RNA polymerase sigma-70 factor (ECF subfamily) [Parapedobacter indicus]SFI32310.1 RNA polymerase sigma-70 factor, ECF subfamily [Parapedobacter indicus]
MDGGSRKNDRELWQALSAGDTAAFTAIYEMYHKNLYLYAFKLVKDADEAADMVQEVFVYLWEKRGDLRLIGEGLPYLYQCVRHRFLNLTDRRKVQEKFVDYLQHRGEYAMDTTTRNLEEKELADYLDSVTNRFSSHMAEVFWLKRQGFQNQEIAGQLNLSVKTVKNLSSAALKQLRFKLGRVISLFLLMLLQNF